MLACFQFAGSSNLSSCFEDKERTTTDLTALGAPEPLPQTTHSVTKTVTASKQAPESTSTRRQLVRVDDEELFSLVE